MLLHQIRIVFVDRDRSDEVFDNVYKFENVFSVFYMLRCDNDGIITVQIPMEQILMIQFEV